MYDVSFKDENDTKEYTKFYTSLQKLGYYRMQYSIYAKTISTHTKYPYEKAKLISILPKNANVRILCISEQQYQGIEILRGSKSLNEKYNDNERYIKL
ncbi:conserved hypothetical protein [Metamycoplasma arthritidis 158L3-1]|uniref:CRISPR-associated endoribonuclease Cas2 n=2 Tax=Metamycoplasma arthritidis TaxID=2111 RepID=B3PMZ0_META1|nr:conserved hypothetical protein [Metamycoplasma arthritidis 158L3-1]